MVIFKVNYYLKKSLKISTLISKLLRYAMANKH